MIRLTAFSSVVALIEELLDVESDFKPLFMKASTGAGIGCAPYSRGLIKPVIRVGFELDHGKRKDNRRGSAQIVTDANEKLFLTVQHHNGAPLGVPTQWNDEEGSPLEDRITDIVVSMAVAGEHLHRRWVAERLAWERERLEEAAREERKRVEAAERRERERLAAIAQAKIDGLLRDAGAWRDAANIRAYVDAARQSADGNMTVFDDWAQWALAEADRIDPMVSGRFMAGYGHRESE